MEIATLHSQPYFPYEDIEDGNLPFVRYYLETESSDKAYGHELQKSLRPLHDLGHQALQILGIQLDYSKDEYDSFCAGFATFEYTARLLGKVAYDQAAAIQKTKSLLIDNEFLADAEIADHFAKWCTSHPNLYGVVLDRGVKEDDSMKQLQARAVGAEIAWEFQV